MKELPPRSTRGKRMSDLIGEEKEYDGVFWEQEIFKETQTDDEYMEDEEEEKGKEDKFDDDFFHQESSDDEIQEPALEKKEKSEKPETNHQKLQKKKKKKLKIEKVPGITQKEMLEQAAIVEMYNTHDLKKLISLEENNKVNLVAQKDKKINATWRYTESNRNGKRKITIWHTEPLSNFIISKPKKKICSITGQAAKYTDPLTGLHYSNKEAFKKIRDDYYSAQEKIIQEHVKNLEEQLNQYS